MTNKTHTLTLALAASDEPTQSIKLEFENIDPNELMRGLVEIGSKLFASQFIFKGLKAGDDNPNPSKPDRPNGPHREGRPNNRSA